MSKRKLRTYDKEFKLNAVKLYQASERSYKQVADELGIPQATLVGWISNYEKAGVKADVFPGKGHLKPSDAEVAQLRKELAIVREERDILKKALGIFSSVRK
jgi:transposase-like protein